MFDPAKEARPDSEGTSAPRRAAPRRSSPRLNRRVLRSINTPQGQKISAAQDYKSDTAYRLQRRLMGFYKTELEVQRDNREEMASDEEFYDGVQWNELEMEDIRDKGMIPIVANVVATTVNWILGTERRMRTEFKILPRRKADLPHAQRKTEYLKFVSDVNYLPFARSEAFAEAVKSGIGWLEDGIQDGGGDPILSRQESWRNLLWDSAAREKDMSDARYMFRVRWIDVDILESLFPHRLEQIRHAAVSNALGVGGIDNSGDWAMDSREEVAIQGGIPAAVEADYARPRVRVIEAWYTKPGQTKVLIRGETPGGTFIDEVYDPLSRGHWNELAAGQAIVADKTLQRVHMCIMTENDILHMQESPYRHNRFPFTPIWCYRRGSTGQPYGVIRGLRTLQEDINRRLMKALAILSSNKTIMDEGAVPDIDTFMDEVSRVDAVIVKKAGKELDINVDRELSAAHLEIMSQSIQMVQSVSGVTDENLGRSTNATSGIAIGRRQDQGSLATAIVFDGLRFASVKQGELQLSLVEQFVSEQREFRVVSQRGQADFKEINTVDPETGEVDFADDITATKADFIISEAAWSASTRQAQVAELLELVTNLAPAAPQVALAVLDLVVESMDVAGRDEIVKRIRQATGMRDPEATELTPEEQAAQDEATAAKDRAIRMEEATIEEKKASGAQKGAQAELIGMQALLAAQDEKLKRVEVQNNAVLAAIQAISARQAAPVADAMLADVGYKGKGEEAMDAAVAAVEESEAAMAEEQAMMGEQPPPEGAPPGGDPSQMPPPAPGGAPAGAPQIPVGA